LLGPLAQEVWVPAFAGTTKDLTADRALRGCGLITAGAERDNAVHRGFVGQKRRMALIGDGDQIDVGPPRDHILHTLT